jgi:CPA1 family monovalent cation:H+ antiporter
VLDAISDEDPGKLALWAAAISATVIVGRILWVFPLTYVPARLSRRIRELEPPPPWRHSLIVAWCGMRGAVSLAAALALPLTTDAGAAFPQRDLIVFLTYSVILSTLVIQGLTLPMIIERLGIHDDGSTEARENKARIKAAKAAIERIDELIGEDWVRDESADRMKRLYEFRIRRFRARFDDEDDGAIEDGSQAYQRLRREVLEAERMKVVSLRNDGHISDEIMHRIERDIDLEDVRLDAPAQPS